MSIEGEYDELFSMAAKGGESEAQQARSYFKRVFPGTGEKEEAPPEHMERAYFEQQHRPNAPAAQFFSLAANQAQMANLALDRDDVETATMLGQMAAVMLERAFEEMGVPLAGDS